MKRILTFIPLGVGISSLIIYLFNVVQFRVINNSTALVQILATLRIYLYISIIGFVCYFIIKVLLTIEDKKRVIEVTDDVKSSNEVVTDNAYEPFENVKEEINISKNEIKEEEKEEKYIPNYSYVPLYKSEEKKKEEKIVIKEEIKEEEKEEIKSGNMYCFNCGSEIYSTDNFCHSCGAGQFDKKKTHSSLVRNIISVIEIVILILVLYFLLNMMFDYKEKHDSNFKSPFKVSMTK